jgi:hypothetical protein
LLEEFATDATELVPICGADLVHRSHAPSSLTGFALTPRRLNNRAENSRQPFRPRERAMQRFRNMKTLQKFSSVHAQFHNHFNQERHLVEDAVVVVEELLERLPQVLQALQANVLPIETQEVEREARRSLAAPLGQ